MTAKAIIHQYLDYLYVKSQADHADYEALRVREKRLLALIDAFGLSRKNYPIDNMDPERIEWFLSIDDDFEFVFFGHFAEIRPKEQNAGINKTIVDNVLELYPQMRGRINNEEPKTGSFFSELLDFRIEISRFTEPEPAPFEGFNTATRYSDYLRNRFKFQVTEMATGLDDLLAMTLDPEGKEIDETTLAEQYNYPEADLKKLDMEWWQKRYDNY